MTKIDENLISKLEKLSKLRLNEQEKKQITKDLKDIVEMFDKLQEVDTSDVEPLRHIVRHRSPMRKDEVKNELSNEEVLKNAPEAKDGFFAVPKFLKPK